IVPHGVHIAYTIPTVFMRALAVFLRLIYNKIRADRLSDFQMKIRESFTTSQISKITIGGFPVFHLKPSRISRGEDLAQASRWRNAGIELPRILILIDPWAELTKSTPAIAVMNQVNRPQVSTRHDSVVKLGLGSLHPIITAQISIW
ncbi:TPA: hypothetical protein ACX37U_001402, partial [Serratia marcescens]